MSRKRPTPGRHRVSFYKTRSRALARLRDGLDRRWTPPVCPVLRSAPTERAGRCTFIRRSRLDASGAPSPFHRMVSASLRKEKDCISRRTSSTSGLFNGGLTALCSCCSTPPWKKRGATSMVGGSGRSLAFSVNNGESIVDAVGRVLHRHGLRPKSIRRRHAYLIYNRRFAEMQAIAVYAAEVDDAAVLLEPSQHSDMPGFRLIRVSSASTIGA